MKRYLTTLATLTLALAAGLLAPLAGVRAETLTALEFDILGLQLTVDPPTLTVPRDIPTIVDTALTLPAGAGPKADAALEALRRDTRVRAQLRGPSIAPQDIEVRPGDPMPIPPFARAGDYVLDGIRLVRGSDTVLTAAPDAVPIQVISEVLVTSVSSRPLALEEIRERGIVIDERNFDIREFQLALNVDGAELKVSLPVALPGRELIDFQRDVPEAIERLKRVNAELAARQVVELPPDFDRPGLNFSVAAIPFMPAGEDGDAQPFGAPPITGLVVIPGNIAFLNQLFSVMLTVANVAPDGSLLTVRDLRAEITLPAGEDRVPGSFDVPGDDPLRLARLEGVGVQPVIDVLDPGPDGALGTADDGSVIAPQAMGEGEFLVEGLREGFHTVDIALSGTLDGLPSGPVEIQGAAVGAVLVRDPTFDITLAHPRTIRAGEPYDLYATITNTSTGPANLVSVSLDPRGVSGAILDPGSESTILIDTLLPGDSFTQRFTLIAQKTGQVTAASFNSERGVTGRFQLTTGVVERGVPASPNTIVLPETVRFLPDGLVSAALRVLGQGFSIATAPAGSLPAGVAFVRRQAIVDRALELGEAGQRAGFGEPVVEVLYDLLLDWLGDRRFDPGFDQLLRVTNAGAALLAEFGEQFAGEVAGGGAAAFLDAFTAQTVPRDGHLAAIAGAATGPAPVELRIFDAEGRGAGPGSDAGERDLPQADLVPMSAGPGRLDLALVAALESPEYVVEARALEDASFDLSLSVPAGVGAAELLEYDAVDLDRGGRARLRYRPGDANTFALELDSDGDGLFEGSLDAISSPILESPPTVLTVRQLESYDLGEPGNAFDPATYGILVAVLYDKPVTEASAADLESYEIEANRALGAVPQPSGRLVYLYLERPVGALVDRSMTISDIVDERGNTLSTVTLPIEMALTDGAHVFGQLRTATGDPVPDAVLDLTIVISFDFAFDVSRIRTDADGNFDFDFVRRIGRYFALTAQHPQTLDFATLNATVRAPGQELLLFPTFGGRGTVKGTVTDAAGDPVAGAPVFLSSAELRDAIGANADEAGRYTITNVPVGPFTVSAYDARGAFGESSAVLAAGGETALADIQLVLQSADLGRLEGRVFLADGVTPAEDFALYVGGYDRRSDTVSAVAQTRTGDVGELAVDDLVAGTYDVVAVDPSGALFGVAKAEVVAGVTSSVVVVLEDTGAVEGIVRDAQGQPVAGALVAGGVTLAETDADGLFRIEGVPPGPRLIQAGNPLNRRRGATEVTVLSNQTVTAVIQLEARATIEGVVRAANGDPVPRATVRMVLSGGFKFVFANNAGRFRFPDLPLGSYLLQAPGPAQAGLIEQMQRRGQNPCAAFTALPPDPPPDLQCQAQVSLSDTNAALAAYQNALETAFSVSEMLLAGPPEADLSGGFGWRRVDLLQDSTTVFADIDYLAQGRVSGVTLASTGLPTAAAVRVTAMGVAANGGPSMKEIGRVETDPVLGEFTFDGVAHFDDDAFLNTGIRSGRFDLEALSSFEAGRPTFTGELNVNTPNRDGIVLQFPAAADSRGTISGTVLLPDGVTPAPADVEVTIDFGDGITVLTDDDGRFESTFPIAAKVYGVTAEDPISGLTGRALANVLPGENTDIELRLLGVGDVRVVVKRPDGTLVANAQVDLVRGTFPGDTLDGATDADGEVRFVDVTEGPFGVMAEEAVTGLKGRASGEILRGEEITLVVGLEGAGAVTGRFLTADRADTVPNAQVVLVSGSVKAYTSTDQDGRFGLDAIPVGVFSVEATDPLTGRIGRAEGTLFAQGDLVEVTLVQIGRGVVEGRVLQGDGVTSVPGARVRLASSGVLPFNQQVTTRADGTYAFDGVPLGAFHLSAHDELTQALGAADGAIAFEGDLKQIDVTLSGFADIAVQVFDPAGSPASNAELQLAGPDDRAAAVDPNGEFLFETLPLGNYGITARSLAQPTNGGRVEVVLDEHAEVVDARIDLRGVGEVSVQVVDAAGLEVGGAEVNLSALGTLPNEAHQPFGTRFTGFTDTDGRIVFQEVPLGEFHVTAEAGAVAGVSNGVVDVPDASIALQVTLGPSGTVHGRVILPDGFTAAADAFVTLRFPPQNSLQSGLLQVTTDLSGTFEFMGIPFGNVTLEAFEPISAGVGGRTGVLDATTPDLDFGDVVLDNLSPRVVSVSPVDGSSEVPVDVTLEIVFNEPVTNVRSDPGGNVVLTDGTSPVAASHVLTDGGRRVLLTPAQPLASDRQHSLTVRGAPLGPADAVGLQLLDSFVSTFRTRDVIPPTIAEQSPAPGGVDVQPAETVFIRFSEAVGPGLTIVLRDGAEQPVAGDVGTSQGDTVATFTPRELLVPNTVYSVELDGVHDLAGNPLGGQPLVSQFSTLDTEAPVITSLGVLGTPIEGRQVTLAPVLGSADVVRVEYGLGALGSSSVGTAPFVLPLSLPDGIGVIQVSAIAVDAAGNRSSPALLDIDVAENGPPAVSLTALDCASPIGTAQTCRFELSATDDVALDRLVFSTLGPGSASQTVDGNGLLALTRVFELTVPATAPSGSTLTVQGSAVDSLGQSAVPASLQLLVEDGIAPIASITSPVNDAQVIPGTDVQVRVQATDDVGVAEVTLDCSPQLLGCETRAVAGQPAAASEVFTVTIADTLAAPAAVGLGARVRDAAGNLSAAAVRTLRIADLVPPEVTQLVHQNGTGRALQGQMVQVLASAGDNVAVAGIEFRAVGDGLDTGPSLVAVAPPASPAGRSFSFEVPQSAANDSVIDVTASALDSAGNRSTAATLAIDVGDVAPPTVVVLEPPGGTVVAAGDSVTLRVSAEDDLGVARIAYETTGVRDDLAETRDIVPATTPAEATFVVDVPLDTPVGDLVMATRATDAAGNPSADAVVNVGVIDTTAPTVAITTPAGGSSHDPRGILGVTVEASDNLAIDQLALTASGARDLDAVRAIAPPSATATGSFDIDFLNPPATGAALRLDASARDTSGNLATATTVVVDILDVVAPAVVQVTPANGDVDVRADAAMVLAFSEPLDPASVTADSVTLVANAPEPLVFAFNEANTALILSPSDGALTLGETHTLTVTTGVTDAAGNALEVAFVSTFTTEVPDQTPPEVVSVSPADGTSEVAIGTDVLAVFSEALDPASVDDSSVVVSVDGVALAGFLETLDGDTTVRFVPRDTLPLAATVTMTIGVGVTDQAGNGLATPFVSSFTTGSFAIVRPRDGSTLPERSTVFVEAAASDGLGVDRVVFTLLGEALDPVVGPPFAVVFETPAAAVVPSLTISAAAFGDGVLIAEDQVTLGVGVALSLVPRVLGVPLDASAELRIILTSPLAEDLEVAVSAVDPDIVLVPSLVLVPAGETSATVVVTGLSLAAGADAGTTAVEASSDLGSDVAIVSVSEVVSGREVTSVATPVGTLLLPPRSVGRVFLPEAGAATIEVVLLDAPAAADTPVLITSDAPGIATVAGTPVIAAGARTAQLDVTTGAAGRALLVLRAGGEVRGLTVVSGTPDSTEVEPVVAPVVGVLVREAPSVGNIVLGAATTRDVTVTLLDAPAAAPTPVAAVSSDPAVADVTAPPTVSAGARDVTLEITTGLAGSATLTLTAGDTVRSLKVFVGAPPAEVLPPVVARPVGLFLAAAPSAGQVVIGAGRTQSVTLPLLDAPASVETPVSVTSSHPTVADVTSQPTVAADSAEVTLDIVTGLEGTALLTLSVDTTVRTLEVFVGTPPTDALAPAVAAPVGIRVLGAPSLGRLLLGEFDARSIAVRLLDATRAVDTPVSVTSSDPNVADVSTLPVVPAGARDAVLSIFTGSPGTARLTLRAGDALRELEVLVGAPPPEAAPPTTAPPVGIEVQP